MSESSYPLDRGAFYEQLPAFALINYFQNQFRDGYAKQSSETLYANTEYNGDFVRNEVIESEHSITRTADRIVMKPPHPNDIPGFYCKVYAIFDKELIRERQDDEPGSSSMSFIVKDYLNGRPGPLWSVEVDGVRRIDLGVDKVNWVAGQDKLTNNDSSDPEEAAYLMLQKLKGYNIVASVD